MLRKRLFELVGMIDRAVDRPHYIAKHDGSNGNSFKWYLLILRCSPSLHCQGMTRKKSYSSKRVTVSDLMTGVREVEQQTVIISQRDGLVRRPVREFKRCLWMKVTHAESSLAPTKAVSCSCLHENHPVPFSSFRHA